jgi:hypothetical protein
MLLKSERRDNGQCVDKGRLGSPGQLLKGKVHIIRERPLVHSYHQELMLKTASLNGVMLASGRGHIVVFVYFL